MNGKMVLEEPPGIDITKFLGLIAKEAGVLTNHRFVKYL
jgi:hypothetical protein